MIYKNLNNIELWNNMKPIDIKVLLEAEADILKSFRHINNLLLTTMAFVHTLIQDLIDIEKERKENG